MIHIELAGSSAATLVLARETPEPVRNKIREANRQRRGAGWPARFDLTELEALNLVYVAERISVAQRPMVAATRTTLRRDARRIRKQIEEL